MNISLLVKGNDDVSSLLSLSSSSQSSSLTTQRHDLKEILNAGQIKFILSWYNLASNGLSCALVTGGWDEWIGGTSTISSSSSLHIPQAVPAKTDVMIRLTSLSYNRQQHGVQRRQRRRRGVWECYGETIEAVFIDDGDYRKAAAAPSSSCPESAMSIMSDDNLFHGRLNLLTMGGRPFVTGSLDRWPLRRQSSVIVRQRGLGTTSHVLDSSSILSWSFGNNVEDDGSGIPLVTVTTIMKAIHHNTTLPYNNNNNDNDNNNNNDSSTTNNDQNQNHNTHDKEKKHNIASFSWDLVRAIRGRLIFISYCCIKAACKKCYRYLTTLSSSSSSSSSLLQFGCPTSSCSANTTTTSNNDLHNTINYNNNSYYEMKWECSGVFDDGTGQAKLHAERDAAKALLGLATNDDNDDMVKAIENAAWMRREEGGLVFQKIIPPGVVLRRFVAEEARRQKMMVKRRRGGDGFGPCEKQTKRNDGDRSSSRLGVVEWGEYLLQNHCRSTSREIYGKEKIFYVKCIAPKEDSNHHKKTTTTTDMTTTTTTMITELKQTEIPVVESGNRGYAKSAVTRGVATYTLPPLRLVLVDVEEIGWDRRDEGWDLIRELRRRQR